MSLVLAFTLKVLALKVLVLDLDKSVWPCKHVFSENCKFAHNCVANYSSYWLLQMHIISDSCNLWLREIWHAITIDKYWNSGLMMTVVTILLTIAVLSLGLVSCFLALTLVLMVERPDLLWPFLLTLTLGCISLLISMGFCNRSVQAVGVLWSCYEWGFIQVKRRNIITISKWRISYQY